MLIEYGKATSIGLHGGHTYMEFVDEAFLYYLFQYTHEGVLCSALVRSRFKFIHDGSDDYNWNARIDPGAPLPAAGPVRKPGSGSLVPGRASPGESERDIEAVCKKRRFRSNAAPICSTFTLDGQSQHQGEAGAEIHIVSAATATSLERVSQEFLYYLRSSSQKD